MSSDIETRVFPSKPFPPSTIFDPLRQFNPIETHRKVKSHATENTKNQIDHFFNKVSTLLRQVNSLSWLHVVWEKHLHSTPTHLSPEARSMTIILLRMYDHIDTGKRYNIHKDREDPKVIANRREPHHLGYTGFSLDDFNGVNRDKNCSIKKRFGQVFNEQWTYTQFKNVFLTPISGICDALYKSKVALFFILSHEKISLIQDCISIQA